MKFQHLEVETKGHVATLWLNRPDKLNAMSADIWEDLPRAVAALDDDPRVRVVVLAGRGRAFSVGIDLEMLAGFGTGSTDREAIYSTVRRLQGSFTSFAEASKPVIVAVHGYCLGAATNLASAADLRLASSDAVFSIRETRMGLVADVGALQRLPGIIGQAATAEMAFTGADYDAAWALEHGLVSTVLEDQSDLMGTVDEIANLIAANSPLVTSGIKAVLRYGAGRPVEDGLEFVAQWNADHLISNDLFEAMAAHLERRPPIFTGE